MPSASEKVIVEPGTDEKPSRDRTAMVGCGSRPATHWVVAPVAEAQSVTSKQALVKSAARRNAACASASPPASTPSSTEAQYPDETSSCRVTEPAPEPALPVTKGAAPVDTEKLAGSLAPSAICWALPVALTRATDGMSSSSTAMLGLGRVSEARKPRSAVCWALTDMDRRPVCVPWANLSSLAKADTSWGMFQLAAVKVSFAGEAVTDASPVTSITTLPRGLAERDTLPSTAEWPGALADAAALSLRGVGAGAAAAKCTAATSVSRTVAAMRGRERTLRMMEPSASWVVAARGVVDSTPSRAYESSVEVVRTAMVRARSPSAASLPAPDTVTDTAVFQSAGWMTTLAGEKLRAASAPVASWAPTSSTSDTVTAAPGMEPRRTERLAVAPDASSSTTTLDAPSAAVTNTPGASSKSSASTVTSMVDAAAPSGVKACETVTTRRAKARSSLAAANCTARVRAAEESAKLASPVSTRLA